VSAVQFLVGLIAPYVVSTALVLVVREVSGRAAASPGAIAAGVLAISVVAAILLWQSYRSVSYGLIAAAAVALVASALWWMGRGSGASPPPP
jgi:hypothetical protein